MKKVLPAAIVLVAIAAAAFVFLKRPSVRHVPATELLPPETIFFAQLPDLRRTAKRWPQTGLAKIWAEPEVQAFLVKPRAKLAQWKGWEARLEQFARIAPGEAFVAVTSIEGPQPKWIAGFSFGGRKAEVEALLAEPRAELKRAWPAGKSDLMMDGQTEIETFTQGETVIAEAFHGDWYFVSNDLPSLRLTLNAAGIGGIGATALANSEIFRKATAPLPAELDTLVFTQLTSLTDRVGALLTATGQATDPKQLEKLKRMQAVAWGTKFEGEQVRDTIFVLSPGGTPEPPLPRSALAFSAPETLLYYAMALPATVEIPQSSLALGAFVPGFVAMEKALADKGLKLGDFGAAFGPEFGSLMDWKADAPQPTALLALDVRDASKARGFVEVFTGGLPGSPAWAHTEQAGVHLFQSPLGAGLSLVTPTIALTEKFLVLGFSPEALSAGLARLKSGEAAIVQSPAYQAAANAVGAPTAGFGYLDFKTLFERSYGMLRPFIAMSLAFSPDAAQYLDVGKLPGTETISKHLRPSVYSQATTAEGTLVESAGTLTFNQVLFASVGGAVAAAFPMLESALAEGFKLDPSLLQMAPPAPPASEGQTPAPAAPVENANAAETAPASPKTPAEL